MKNIKKILSGTFGILSIFLATALIVVSCTDKKSETNPYNLELINTYDAYMQSVAADSANLMVDLEMHIPGIVLDIRYADTNNFTGKKIYTAPKAFMRLPAADSLLKIQKLLAAENLGIKVYDAYRPYAGTLYFYEVYPDTTFVAAPWKGSIHNRGVAIDLTLINLETGEELAMPTPFDEFSERASHNYMDIDSVRLVNRDKLKTIMIQNGFTMYEHEWWHYNLKDRSGYALMDISFEDLEKQK